MLNKLIVPGNVGKNAGKKGLLLPYIFCGTPLPLCCIVLWNVKNGVGFHVLSLIMLEGIEANKWIKSSGYSYVTEINPIVQWILDYYVNIDDELFRVCD